MNNFSWHLDSWFSTLKVLNRFVSVFIEEVTFWIMHVSENSFCLKWLFWKDVQWNDIDYAVDKRDFTSDTARFGDQSAMVAELHRRGMRYIVIVVSVMLFFLLIIITYTLVEPPAYCKLARPLSHMWNFLVLDWVWILSRKG